MISASVQMAKASFIRAEQPLAPHLTADRAVLRTGVASRHCYIVFVVKPRGANGRTGKECKKLLPYLRSRLGSECNICESLTAGPCNAIDITREGADAIIAVGEDGTLHVLYKFRRCAKNTTNQDSEPENLFLKIAWYGSEFLGIAASFLRSPTRTEDAGGGVSELSVDGFGKIDRAVVVAAIKEDFQRSYFVTVESLLARRVWDLGVGKCSASSWGNLALDAYEEDCEFADPAGSFRGLSRFKRNCTNFGYLLENSNMKLMKWEDFEEKGIGHWRFICVMSFPWKPILSATGYTEYYFDEKSGKICRHVEHWNVPKMTLLKQILKPSRGLFSNKSSK